MLQSFESGWDNLSPHMHKNKTMYIFQYLEQCQYLCTEKYKKIKMQKRGLFLFKARKNSKVIHFLSKYTLWLWLFYRLGSLSCPLGYTWHLDSNTLVLKQYGMSYTHLKYVFLNISLQPENEVNYSIRMLLFNPLKRKSVFQKHWAWSS